METVLRDLQKSDLAPLEQLLSRIVEFDADDCSIAIELLTIILEKPKQKDYLSTVAVGPSGLPVGYACYGPTPLTDGTYDLYWIAVDPACAGQGIGSRLVQAMEEKIRSLNGRMIIIETSSKEAYKNTRQFYLKNGYILGETICDFYRLGEDRVTYLKRL